MEKIEKDLEKYLSNMYYKLYSECLVFKQQKKQNEKIDCDSFFYLYEYHKNNSNN
jgi:hypothetical protein